MPNSAKGWNTFDYSACDRTYNWINAQGAQMRFHAIVWPNTAEYMTPDFIKNSNDNAAKEQFLMDYIAATMSHYQTANIYAWDVMNEIIDD